jgi:hypothetical protein
MSTVLANLFFFGLNIGGSGTKFLTISVGVGNAAPITYDLVQLLIILGIAVIAAVVLEKLLHRATPGGLLGAFFIALLGVVIFITLVPLVWKGDFALDGVPLITSLIGAFLALLVVSLLAGGGKRRWLARA